jgi:D-alanyl-D-alanine-carboxypeptidase/D-alanyl-D-alanine-endopeptidase
VLSNAGFNGIDDVAMHLINPEFPIDQYPPQIAVDAAVLATYAGTYRQSPNYALTIRADGTRLFVRGTGHREFELFADDTNRFFMRSDDAQAIFLPDADGRVRTMIWHQNGRYRYYQRLG